MSSFYQQLLWYRKFLSNIKINNRIRQPLLYVNTGYTDILQTLATLISTVRKLFKSEESLNLECLRKRTLPYPNAKGKLIE